ncbi:MAG: hypothetical protein ACK5HO_11440 [Pseudomonadota bacterium]|jgi:hypothetical protein
MVRTDTLRAKSLHAEVAYLQDLKRVSDAKLCSDQKNLALRNKERDFWSEALGAHSPAKSAASQREQSAFNLQTCTRLERMRRAHSQLQDAHRASQSAASVLKDGIKALATSQKRNEILEGMIVKAERIRANQIESALSEEMANLVASFRLVKKTGLNFNLDRPSAELTPFTYNAERPTSRAEGLECAPRFQNTLAPMTRDISPGVPSAFSRPRSDLFRSGGVVVNSCPSPAQILIREVVIGSVNSQPSISLRCQLGARGAVSLQITKVETGAFRVVIDPGSATGGLIREKGAIQARLNSLGIRVAELEIAAPEGMPGIIKRLKRPSGREEDDERYIA